MQVVVAIIKPFKLEEVKHALEPTAIKGMTVIDAKGFGRQKGHTELYRGAEYAVDYLPKIVLLIVVPDNQAEQVKQDVMNAARTDKLGDGIVFSISIADYLRIRTGEIVNDEDY